jgi:RND family efflux transporter MFP subunit
MKKFTVIVLFLAVSGGLTWLVWVRPVEQPREEKKPEAEAPVHVATITRATLRSCVIAYSPVEPEPKASARVAPAMPGVVAEVQCSEGRRVEKGTLLFQLDSRAVDVAASFAEKTLERQQRLAKVEGTSQKTLQEAELTLATAHAQQALLQVRSPLGGMVTKVNTKAGEAADLATVLAEVVDLDRLVVSANVSSAELVAVKPGQPVEVLAADSTNTLNASLSYASAQVDPKTGAGLVRAAVPAGSGLRPGQFVKMRIIAGEHKGCLTVPVASVAKDAAGGAFIALVEGEKADMAQAELHVDDRLSQIRATLPATVSTSTRRLTFSAFPILGVSLTSPRRTNLELWEMAR